MSRKKENLETKVAEQEKEMKVKPEGAEQIGEMPEIPVFYVTLKEPEILIRNTPEYRPDNSNVSGRLLNERKPIGIVKMQNGYGRLADGNGWIQLCHTARFNG